MEGGDGGGVWKEEMEMGVLLDIVYGWELVSGLIGTCFILPKLLVDDLLWMSTFIFFNLS